MRQLFTDTHSMNTDLFLIGIDGGGTGTRVVLGDAHGRELAQAASGPSGLGLGVERAPGRPFRRVAPKRSVGLASRHSGNVA